MALDSDAKTFTARCQNTGKTLIISTTTSDSANVRAMKSSVCGAIEAFYYFRRDHFRFCFVGARARVLT